MDIIESGVRRTRRRHSVEFKARMVEACCHTGVSIAAVALANGLNANLLRNWVVESRQISAPPSSALPSDSTFVPLAITPTTTSSEISIEVQRGSTRMQIRWPAHAAADCAVWLREWLR